jgi:hypothetical protein
LVTGDAGQSRVCVLVGTTQAYAITMP